MAEFLLQATLLVAAGVGAQWLAWRLRLPSILLLLVAGLALGPGLGLLHPDALVGDALGPIVSMAVAIILFEGGLSLRFREVRGQGSVVSRLVSLGVLVTAAVAALAARFILHLDWALAVLLGSILVVSGPTVMQPLLRQIRPKEPVASILRWEGILVDPVGATLALLAFEALIQSSIQDSVQAVVVGVAATVGSGLAVALVGAVLLLVLERRYWLPDYLSAPVTLATVLGVYGVADLLQPESGLLAVTLMGVALANQRWVAIHHILDFKENLSLLLIAALFVLLSARMDRSQLALIDANVLWFILVLVLVARPLAATIGTMGSALSWRERAFLGWMAPRGIVAAAVAAFFALRLEGVPGAQQILPVTFATILVTVVLYGLTARPVGRMLGVLEPPPNGVLLIGANAVTRAIAKALGERDKRALIASTHGGAVSAARMDDLDAVRANVHSVHLTDEVDLSGIGKLWAVSPREEANSLAAVHFADEFGRVNVFQVAVTEEEGDEALLRHRRGRPLFGTTYRRLRDKLRDGWDIRSTPITRKFTFHDYKQVHAEFIPLWVENPEGRLEEFGGDTPAVYPGCVLAALVPPDARTTADPETEMDRPMDGPRGDPA